MSDLLLKPLEQILATATQPAERETWLIRNFLPAKGVAVLYGPTGVGKTFLVLDMMLSIAAGLPWGHESVKDAPALPSEHDLSDPGPKAARTQRLRPKVRVIYWIGEGRENAEQRVLTWALQAEQQRDRLAQTPPSERDFSFIDGYVTGLLLSGKNAPRNQLPEGLHQLRNALKGGDPDAVPVLVVDTLSATHPEMDENDTRAAGLVMENCRRLAEEINGLVFLVHHSGKARAGGPRGHSRLMGDPDVIFHVTPARNEDRRMIRLQVEKQRMSWQVPDLFFELTRPDPRPGAPAGLPPFLKPWVERTRTPLAIKEAKRSWAVLSNQELMTARILDGLDKWLTAEGRTFRQSEAVRHLAGRLRKSDSTIYTHLSNLRERWKLITAEGTPGKGLLRLLPYEGEAREVILKLKTAAHLTPPADPE